MYTSKTKPRNPSQEGLPRFNKSRPLSPEVTVLMNPFGKFYLTVLVPRSPRGTLYGLLHTSWLLTWLLFFRFTHGPVCIFYILQYNRQSVWGYEVPYNVRNVGSNSPMYSASIYNFQVLFYSVPRELLPLPAAQFWGEQKTTARFTSKWNFLNLLKRCWWQSKLLHNHPH